jgi:hypothetical protein
VIDVDHGGGERVVEAGRAIEFAGQLLIERAAVGDAGQGILDRLSLQ